VRVVLHLHLSASPGAVFRLAASGVCTPLLTRRQRETSIQARRPTIHSCGWTIDWPVGGQQGSALVAAARQPSLRTRSRNLQRAAAFDITCVVTLPFAIDCPRLNPGGDRRARAGVFRYTSRYAAAAGKRVRIQQCSRRHEEGTDGRRQTAAAPARDRPGAQSQSAGEDTASTVSWKQTSSFITRSRPASAPRQRGCQQLRSAVESGRRAVQRSTDHSSGGQETAGVAAIRQPSPQNTRVSCSMSGNQPL
jgi:hypothetical protein